MDDDGIDASSTGTGMYPMAMMAILEASKAHLFRCARPTIAQWATWAAPADLPSCNLQVAQQPERRFALPVQMIAIVIWQHARCSGGGTQLGEMQALMQAMREIGTRIARHHLE